MFDFILDLKNIQTIHIPKIPRLLLYNNIKITWFEFHIILHKCSSIFFTKRINRLYWNNYTFFFSVYREKNFYFPKYWPQKLKRKILFCWLNDCIFYAVLSVDQKVKMASAKWNLHHYLNHLLFNLKLIWLLT